jgi:amino acid adenylation domain-containing protein
MLEKKPMQTGNVTAVELITRLRNDGVSLSRKNEQLHYKAPKGILQESDLQALKLYKTDILEFLQEESEPVTVVPDPNSRFAPFPLTDVQVAYLLGRSNAFEYGGVACHIYLEINYKELEHKRVEAVWNQLIERHDMLRAIISQDGQQQQVMDKAPWLAVDYVDASGFDEQKLGATLQEIREEMDHRIYDTEKWPLFGISLTKTLQHCILHFSIEFLIADGASVWFLLGEFEALYFETGRKLPDLQLTFRDYVITERNMKNSTAYFKDKQYWLDKIDQLPPAPDLPLGGIKDSEGPARFRRRFFKLEGQTWNSFKERTQKQGITPTSAVMTAYAAVLERWSKKKAFSLNLTVLNRQPLHEQVYDIVGDFTSVSLLAVDWRAENSFKEQAKALNTQLFSDLDHRLFSGVEVLREITRRKGREKALMPIVLTSAIGLIDSNESYKLQGDIVGHSITQTPQVFIDCQVSDTDYGIQINWDVREGVFPAQMVDDMFQTFETLVQSLTDNDQSWESNVVLPLPKYQLEERQQANSTKAPLPDRLLHHEIIEQMKNNGSLSAIIDSEGETSYEELGKRASAVTQKLKELGCEPQERVAIVMGKCASQVTAVLGTLSAGGVYVPIDKTQPEIRRTTIIEQANIRFVLTRSDVGIQWPENTQAIEVDKLKPLDKNTLQASGDPELPAYIIYTSGSTGTPKGVVISHRAALNTIEDINKRFQVTDSDRILGLAQLGFDLSVYDLFGLLRVGGVIVFPNQDRMTDPSHWAQLMAEHEITLWNSVPALMQMLVSYLSSEKNIQLPKFRKALLSGDWIPINLPDQLIHLVPSVQVVSLGGATEASIWSIYHEYKELKPEWKSIPYGRPLTNQGFRVLDSQMRDCPVWVAGELYITGDGLAQGYFGNHEVTDKSFFAHPKDGQRLYRSGDLGRYVPGGEIELLGREDNQVKIKGNRIELGEIEAALQKHNAVAAAGVVVDGSGDDRALLGVVETVRQKEKAAQGVQADLEQLFQSFSEQFIFESESTNKKEDYLNHAIGVLTQKIAAAMPDEKLRILEIGAGSGRRAAKVLECIDNIDVDYIVTDSNAENVTKAQTKFEGLKNLRFTVFDINGDYRLQGFAPNSFDIVLAAKITKDAIDIKTAIKKLTEIISPGGQLFFTGPRQGQVDSNGWLNLLQENCGSPSMVFPSDKDDFASLSECLFVAAVKQDKANVRVTELIDFIAQRLPAYMIPTHVQIVDALPLTDNGKVDRKALSKWRPKVMQEHSADENSGEEIDELETKLSQLWISALGITGLSRSQNVYDLGADSLVIAQVASKVREMLNESPLFSADISFDNLVRHMLNYPTVEDLAELIRSLQSDQITAFDTVDEKALDDSQSNGVFTDFGGGNSGPFRVVFHAGLGTLNSYMLLLDHLDKQQLGPVIGVTIKDMEKYCELDPDDAVEHIAEDYAKHLAKTGNKEVQLIGHCLGGFTAIEVARRFLERGIGVRDLVLVDSLPILTQVDDDWFMEIIFVSAGGVSIQQCGFGEVSPMDLKQALTTILSDNPEKIPHGATLSIGGNAVLDKVRAMFQKLNTMSFRERFNTYGAVMNNVHGKNMPGEWLEGLYKIYRQRYKAAGFTPPPYMGDVRFLLAEESFDFLPHSRESTLNFWRDIVLGDFQVAEITGNHNTCVEQEPHVTKLAKLIAEPLI